MKIGVGGGLLLKVMRTQKEMLKDRKAVSFNKEYMLKYHYFDMHFLKHFNDNIRFKLEGISSKCPLPLFWIQHIDREMGHPWQQGNSRPHIWPPLCSPNACTLVNLLKIRQKNILRNMSNLKQKWIVSWTMLVFWFILTDCITFCCFIKWVQP